MKRVGAGARSCRRQASPPAYLEAQLGAELEQAPAHDLNRVPPQVIRGAVPRVLVENSAPVEDVIEVEIPLQLAPPHQIEDPAEAEIHLPDPIAVERVGRDQ